jgi:hypothetical protein
METGLRRKIAGLCLLAGSCWSGSAAAQDSPPAALPCLKGLEAKVVEKLGYRLDDQGPDGLQSDCKPWPADPALSIVAVATLHPGPDDGQGIQEYDLDTFVVRSASGHVVNHLRQPGAIVSDAVRFDGLSIDTARFHLRPGVRAFGVALHYVHSSRAAPATWTALNLYQPEGRTLRPVLSGLMTELERGPGIGCGEEEDQISRTLAIGAVSHRGFADLVVTSKTIVTDNRKVDGECQGMPQAPQIERRTLEFDGKAYAVPQDWSGS